MSRPNRFPPRITRMDPYVESKQRPTYAQMYCAMELAACGILHFGYGCESEGDEDWIYPWILISDTFCYACADSEEISWEEVPILHGLYYNAENETEADKNIIRWVAKRRGIDPIPEVKKWLDE